MAVKNPTARTRTVEHFQNFTRESRLCWYGGNFYCFTRVTYYRTTISPPRVHVFAQRIDIADTVETHRWTS